MKRDNTLDILKGVGIILMVIGHTVSPFSNWIYLFHMAVFFILAGYNYNEEHSDNIESCYTFTKKRIEAYYKPFVLWNISYLLLTNFFIKINIYTNNTEFLNQLEGAQEGLVQPVNFYDLAKGAMQIFTFGSKEQLAGVSWFLLSLFTVSVAYNTINFLLKARTKKHLAFQFIISLALLLLGYKLSLLNIRLPRLLSASISIYSLYFTGKLIRKYSILTLNTPTHIVLLTLISSFTMLIMVSPCGNIVLSLNQYVNPLFLLITSLSGWFLCFSVSILINRTTLSNLFGYLGRNTIPIMFLHFLSFKVVNLVFTIYYSKPLYTIASFPVAHKSWWYYYSIVGISLPLLLNFTFKKTKNLILTKT